MNRYETLKSHMNLALKNGEKLKRLTLADIVATIDKTATSGKTRIEITDSFVDEILIKYQKTVQEMIDTCPNNEKYAELKKEYKAKLEIVMEYAPTLENDPEAIRQMILAAVNNEYAFEKKNKGQIMRIVMPILKGKVDMAIANKVLAEMFI